jgi:hypothetical protein
MLLKQSTLAGIAAGTITCVYRRWRRPLVKAGSTFRTAIGVIAVQHIEPTTLDAITASGVRSAGYASRAALIADLARYGSGDVYWIRLKRVGDDPRRALRERTRWTQAEVVDINKRLARFDATSRNGPWVLKTLRLIARNPGRGAVYFLPARCAISRATPMLTCASARLGFSTSAFSKCPIASFSRPRLTSVTPRSLCASA